MGKLKSWKNGFFLVLVLNLLWAGWFLWGRGDLVADFKNDFPLLDPSRSFVAQKDFIINLQPLREDLGRLVDSQSDLRISLYFEFLNTGANISVNPEVKVWPASLLKVPVAMAVMKKIENGVWSLDKEISLSQEDKDANYGGLYAYAAGTKFSVDELLKQILVYSDDTAYWMLLRNLDAEDLDGLLAEVGMDGLFNKEGMISAKEYSRFLRSLYTSSFLKRESSEKILALMDEAVFQGFLSSGLPSDVVFSHKFGVNTDRHAYLDSGIIYIANRPCLISVAILGSGGAKEERKVEDFMRAVAESAYQYISGY